MGTNESLRIKVGLFKFADFRPKHCVLAGASGTHSLCVYNSSKCQTDDVGYPTLRYTNIPSLLGKNYLQPGTP